MQNITNISRNTQPINISIIRSIDQKLYQQICHREMECIKLIQDLYRENQKLKDILRRAQIIQNSPQNIPFYDNGKLSEYSFNKENGNRLSQNSQEKDAPVFQQFSPTRRDRTSFYQMGKDQCVNEQVNRPIIYQKTQIIRSPNKGYYRPLEQINSNSPKQYIINQNMSPNKPKIIQKNKKFGGFTSINKQADYCEKNKNNPFEILNKQFSNKPQMTQQFIANRLKSFQQITNESKEENYKTQDIIPNDQGKKNSNQQLREEEESNYSVKPYNNVNHQINNSLQSSSHGFPQTIHSLQPSSNIISLNNFAQQPSNNFLSQTNHSVPNSNHLVNPLNNVQLQTNLSIQPSNSLLNQPNNVLPQTNHSLNHAIEQNNHSLQVSNNAALQTNHYHSVPYSNSQVQQVIYFRPQQGLQINNQNISTNSLSTLHCRDPAIKNLVDVIDKPQAKYNMKQNTNQKRNRLVSQNNLIMQKSQFNEEQTNNRKINYETKTLKSLKNNVEENQNITIIQNQEQIHQSYELASQENQAKNIQLRNNFIDNRAYLRDNNYTVLVQQLGVQIPSNKVNFNNMEVQVNDTLKNVTNNVSSQMQKELKNNDEHFNQNITDKYIKLVSTSAYRMEYGQHAHNKSLNIKKFLSPQQKYLGSQISQENNQLCKISFNKNKISARNPFSTREPIKNCAYL